MSATDRLRGKVDFAKRMKTPGGSTVSLDVDEAEALCDLADAVRVRHSKQVCMTCDFYEPCAIAKTLARLDEKEVRR